ncbi:MAG: crossover junction endodeoxyribonuclease RuvC [Planctomycetota bacterium]|jgi:crossover junction endodeoxyribonuclease RuvC
MRILGIDPGLSLTGYGCLDVGGRVGQAVVVEAGVLRLRARAPIPERLAQLHEDLGGLLDELRPQRMVVEQLFSHYQRVRTAIVMGHARGVVLLAGQLRGVEIGELAPSEVKKAIAGNGHATKAQMQQAVAAQCGLEAIPDPPDVADAIALALCAARRLEVPTA